jgi:hypothetical protein
VGHKDPRPIVSHTAFELLIDPHGRERVLFDGRDPRA